MIEKLRAALAALEELSRLGNGDQPGNSIGNSIAQRALPDLRSVIAEMEAGEPVAWQPIETAPKDFVTIFDGWNGERVANVTWANPEYSPKGHHAFCVSEYTRGHGWDNVEVKGLTHWMPYPCGPDTHPQPKADKLYAEAKAALTAALESKT
jgi:hypothetical protein